jgi:hypothetical protein
VALELCVSVFFPATRKQSKKGKVNGITLNYEKSMVVSFTSLMRIILEANTPLRVHYSKKVKRNMVVS